MIVLACLLLIGFAVAPVLVPSEDFDPRDDVFSAVAEDLFDDEDDGDEEDGDDDDMNLSIADLPREMYKAVRAIARR